jgi:hypothetical protein
MTGSGDSGRDMPGDIAATMAALGIGAERLTVGRLFSRPDLNRRMQSLAPLAAAVSFGGLLTVPELGPNAIRIEALVHAALALGHGRGRLDGKTAAEAFRHLGVGDCGRMEDPSEDVLVGAVRTSQGNFRVLQGIWEGSCFYLQRFLDVTEAMPGRADFDAIRSAVTALLRLSEAICERGSLRRFGLGADYPASKLPRGDVEAWLARGRILRFCQRDLAALGVDAAALKPFIFDMRFPERLVDEPAGNTSLERSPLVVDGDDICLVLPTAVSAAIRYFIVGELERSGHIRPFRRALAGAYTALFHETAVLGGGMAPAIPFSPATGFGEAVWEFDTGYYLHFLFFVDGLDGIATEGLASVDPRLFDGGEDFDRAVRRARDDAFRKPGFRAGVSLIVGCGVGRGVVIGFGEEDLPDWRVVSCPAHDLVTLSETADFKASSLWRILDARDKAAGLGLELQNVNGLLNLVAWARDLDGHIVPHGQLPDDFVEPQRPAMVMIVQNAQRALRHEAAQAHDLRVETFVDGRRLRIRREAHNLFADDDLMPLYASEDVARNGKPYSVFLGQRHVWWACAVTDPTAMGIIAYERWRTVGTWLTRAATLLDGLSGLPGGPILWDAVFEYASEELRPTPVRRTYEDARQAIQISVDRAAGTLTTVIGSGYEDAQFHEENIAERALVAAFIHGVALLAGHPSPEIAEAEFLPLIVRNPSARHGHAFSASGFRDQVRPGLRGRVATIGRETDAFIRLGLGWAVHERSQGARLAGKADCNAFLNALVMHIEREIVSELQQYDRHAMLGLLLENHERAASDRDQWRRTGAAVVGLHGDSPETRQVLIDRQFKLNAVFQACRTLAEIALCECRTDGGLTPGRLDLESLMARAALLFNVGGWSDSIRWDLMKPELRVTPLGDVHANFDFHDAVVLPHARMMTGSRVEDAIDNYAENLVEPTVTPASEDRLEGDFGEAWADQFGATFDQKRLFVDYVENLGVEAASAVLTLPRSRIADAQVEVGGNRLDDLAKENLLERLTLRTRPSWRQVPEGFADRDRQPWRFRRRLSLIQRPIMQIDDLPDPTLVVAPGMVRDAFAQMAGLLHRGDLPANQLSPKMLAWRSRVTGARGTAFAKEVAAALESDGWKTRVELNVTELLHRGFDRNYGDVDVLAWRSSPKRVLVIECKDVQFSKTHGEIAEQLADFRGEIRPDGRRDELRKHLDRMEIIRSHLQEVSRFVGIDELPDVESHLVFRHPVPMEFALLKMAEQVTVSRLAVIRDI